MTATDPTMFAAALTWVLAAVPRVAAGIAILGLGLWAAGVLERMVLRVMERSFGGDLTLRGVLGTVVRYGVIIVAMVAALAQFGIETSSILTVLAAAGLAVGLALQATLANIAAGIMLLWLRPFKVGDRVTIGPLTGKIVEVGLFASEIHTGDGLYQFMPNSELWNKRLTNLSRLPTRQVEVPVKLKHPADVEALRDAVDRMGRADPRILPEPAPSVAVVDLAADTVAVAVRVWTATADHDAVQQAVADAVLEVIARRGAEATG